MKRKEIMKKFVCDYLWILIYLYLICHGTHWRANKKKPLDMHLSCTLVKLSWAVRYGRYWQVSLSKYLYINVYNLLIKFPRQYKYNDFWKYSIFLYIVLWSHHFDWCRHVATSRASSMTFRDHLCARHFPAAQAQQQQLIINCETVPFKQQYNSCDIFNLNRECY